MLLCAKSRVAPLKKISLPRLELCATVLLATLAKRAITALEINFHRVYYWTDSMITLCWLQGEPAQWKTFIANRVGEIQSQTKIDDWYHVRSHENPADLISRGVDVNTLLSSQLWWHGPSWFSIDNAQWNVTKIKVNDDIPEMRTTESYLVTANETDVILKLIAKISSFTRLNRITAYLLRFVKNCRLPREVRQTQTLKVDEIDEALLLLVKTVQKECFRDDYNCLLKGKPLNLHSKLLALNPFLHAGVIRVGGRLQKADISFDKKHQILLPKKHHFTDLLLRYEHRRLLHCGAQNLLYSIRERFWIISGRNTCKGIIRTCGKCFKMKPIGCNYLMGNLPKCRVSEFAPFLNVGIDYGGPFFVREKSGRGGKLIKAYICLFICMSSKAIHLELVTNLTTTAFMATFTRFISRRGKPSNIYSDNGKTFVGANRELQKLYDFLSSESNVIYEELGKECIKWHFIPPRSPAFGGIWEAGIKSTKFHIKRVIGDKAFTFEDFYTILSQIEGIVNSRPLSPISENPNDLQALTPAHLLIGRSLTALPERDITAVPENRLNRYQRLQAMSQHFWSRWSREYLTELQTRVKWKTNGTNMLKVGTLVLVKNDGLPSYNWQLGRVREVFPGADGVVRVADVQVQRGVLRRAINNLCVLPLE